MFAVLGEESLTSLCSLNTESAVDDKDCPCLRAHRRISNSAILNNSYARVQVKKMVSQIKP